VDECSLPLSLSCSDLICVQWKVRLVWLGWLRSWIEKERRERVGGGKERNGLLDSLPLPLVARKQQQGRVAAGERRRGEGRVVVRCAFFAPDILARIGPLPHAPSLLHTRPSNLPFFLLARTAWGIFRLFFFPLSFVARLRPFTPVLSVRSQEVTEKWKVRYACVLVIYCAIVRLACPLFPNGIRSGALKFLYHRSYTDVVTDKIPLKNCHSTLHLCYRTVHFYR
jgi:hypothetical protein